MQIKELELNRFRNYDSQRIEFDPGINIIYGNNGEGKTNIVEAVYILSFGRSFRTSKDKEMIHLGSETSYVRALVNSQGRDYKIDYRLSKSIKKAIKINNLPIEKLSDLLGTINVVVFSPEDLKLVKEGPKERRSFIDREISQIKPRYYELISNYHKTLLQRNNLLKMQNPDQTLLEVYEHTLGTTGFRIIEYREEFLKRIADISKKNHKSISSGKEELVIEYEKDVKADSAQEYISILGKNRDNDILRRTTNKGIHKDDIDIKINGIDLRSFGSQGQKRSAAISIKLSEIELIKEIKGEYPIVILDDIFSELDKSRQHMLLETIKHTQTFVTTAEEFNIDVQTTKYHVVAGKLTKI